MTTRMKFCERFIILNTGAVLKSSGFLECDRQTLAHILKANLLICSEVELFEVCMAWVKAESGQNALSKEIVDEYMGELFYQTVLLTQTWTPLSGYHRTPGHTSMLLPFHCVEGECTIGT